jgi:glycosyltransferase involved in cell wall biosynthesis
MATHNGERFVAEQLTSILDQRVRPTEIVISDDASTDGTLDVVRSVLADDQRGGEPIAISILENKTALGVTKNFEQAMLACHGDYISLADQDDSWHPDRLGSLIDLFDAPGVLLASSNARLVDAQGRPLGLSLFDALQIRSGRIRSMNSDRAVEELLRRNLVTGATVMIRRELLEAAVPFPPAWVHDEWLAVIAALTGAIRVLPDQLIDYRQHGSNQIGATQLTVRQKFRRLVEPRKNKNEMLLKRATVLIDRVEQLPVGKAATYLPAIREKVAHLSMRASLPAPRVQRILPVLRESFSGRYSRYSRGAADVMRDLLQPEA